MRESLEDSSDESDILIKIHSVSLVKEERKDSMKIS